MKRSKAEAEDWELADLEPLKAFLRDEMSRGRFVPVWMRGVGLG